MSDMAGMYGGFLLGGAGMAAPEFGNGTPVGEAGWGSFEATPGHGNFGPYGGFGNFREQPGFGQFPKQGGFGNFTDTPGFGNFDPKPRRGQPPDGPPPPPRRRRRRRRDEPEAAEGYEPMSAEMEEEDVPPDALYQEMAQQQPEPEPERRPQPVAEFTQADQLRMAKLQQALAGTQRQVDEGELYPDEGQVIVNDIESQLGPLRERQQAAQSQAKQQAAREAMEQAAQAVAIQQQNASIDAQAFPSRTAVVTDPLTGRAAHFYQSEPGKWQPVQFEEMAAPMSANDQAAFDEGTRKGQPGFGPAAPQEAPDEQLTFGPDGFPVATPRMTGPPRPRDVAAEYQAAGMQPPEDVYERAVRETFPNARAAGPRILRPDGTEIGGGAGADPRNPYALSQAEMDDLRRRAESMIPRVSGGGGQWVQQPGSGVSQFVPDPHSMVAVRQRESQVANLLDHMVTQTVRARQHQADWSAKVAEHRRLEEARVARDEKKEKAKQEKDNEDRWYDHYDKDYKEEVEKWRKKHGEDKPLPDHLKDRGKYIRDHIQEKKEFLHPELKEKRREEEHERAVKNFPAFEIDPKTNYPAIDPETGMPKLKPEFVEKRRKLREATGGLELLPNGKVNIGGASPEQLAEFERRLQSGEVEVSGEAKQSLLEQIRRAKERQAGQAQQPPPDSGLSPARMPEQPPLRYSLRSNPGIK